MTASATASAPTASATAETDPAKGTARAYWASLCLIALVASFMAMVTWPLWATAIPGGPDNRLTTISVFLTPIVTAVGVIVALATWHRTHKLTIARSRKQHTIKILFETRLSDEFRLLHESRETHHPPFRDVTYEDWERLRDDIARAGPNDRHLHQRKESLTSLLELLNYYEFLAIGIRMEDLDEEMLRGTVRSMMCNLVDDCRDLIAGLRVHSPTAFDNLCWLYDRWRDPERVDIYGKPNERPIPDKGERPDAA